MKKFKTPIKKRYFGASCSIFWKILGEKGEEKIFAFSVKLDGADTKQTKLVLSATIRLQEDK